MDTEIMGARMLEHAERVMSAVYSTAARASRPDQVSHGGRNHECPSDGVRTK
jgi:hypothetical protein